MVDLAELARLFAHPVRASIVTELLGGVPLTSGALAIRAGVSPSAVSNHLAILVAGRIVTVTRAGRWRLYELADSEIARLVEAMSSVAKPEPVRSLRADAAARRMRLARSCYDHLAGRVAIAVVDCFVDRGWLTVDAAQRVVDLSPDGESEMRGGGFDLPSRGFTRRSFIRGCIDWTERREHLAGGVGEVLMSGMLSKGWILRRPGDRSVAITPTGHRELTDRWGIDSDALAVAV